MTQKQVRVLSALLSTPSKEAAAAEAGVSRQTVDNYLADPDFRAEYNAQRSSMVDAACTTLQAALTDAASTLTEIMKNTENSPGSRIQAARSVLEYGVKLTELTDLAARVEALETAQKEREE